MPSRQRSSEADGPRNGRIRDAGGGNVRLQIPDGAGAKYLSENHYVECLAYQEGSGVTLGEEASHE